MTIYQRPNKPLIAMVLSGIIMLFLHGFAAAAIESIFVLSGTIWSYLELSGGVNRFRKSLGIVGFIIVLVILVPTLYYG